MKRIICVCITALALMGSVTVQADEYDWSEYRNSLSISVGCPSGYYAFRGLFVDIWVSALDHADNAMYYGSYSMQYHYQVLRWLRVGFKGSWEGDSHDMYTDKEKTTQKGKSFGHTVALMASAQFTYLNKRHVQLYSGIDVGPGVMLRENRYINGYSDSEGKTYNVSYTFLPDFNVTPIGVCFGNERVYGLAEVNIGADAFFKGGIGVHL